MVKATPKTRSNAYTYADAGVDIKAGNNLVESIKVLAESTKRAGADASLGGFGGIFDLKALGMNDPLLVAATDGVGTKLRLAIDSSHHTSIGIDLVAMCVNDLIVQGATPLFFLDYLATGKLDQEVARDVISGIAEGCRQAECALIGGETAEMPGHYAGADYDLAGFSVGAVERHKILPRIEDLASGDRLIGIASSGLHSNGYSLVRRLIDDFNVDVRAAAPFGGGPLLDILLAPTRIYVKSLLPLMAGSKIKAAAHITGGGLTENIPRVLPETLCAEISLSEIKPHPLFGWLSDIGGIRPEEMLKTFNCGVGMVVVVGPEMVDDVVTTLTGAGEIAFALGELTSSADSALSQTNYIGSLNFDQSAND